MLRTKPEPEPVAHFSTLDRCDGCRAQAVLRAEKIGKAELLFCGHHAAEHHERLVAEGWMIEADNG